MGWADNVLGSPDQYDTPEQQKFARDMAEALLQKQGTLPVRHWTEGVAHVLHALSGARYRDLAIQGQKQGTASKGLDLSKVYAPRLPVSNVPLGTSPRVTEDDTGTQAPLIKTAGRTDYQGRDKKAFDFFVSKGWSPEQAAGLVANIQHESGFNHQAVGDKGMSYGLGQWQKDRRTGFNKFANKPIEKSSFEDQLGYVHHELTAGNEKTAGEMLRKVNDPHTAGGLISNLYQRPRNNEYNNRGLTAKNILEQFNTPINDQSPGKMSLGGPGSKNVDPAQQPPLMPTEGAAPVAPNVDPSQLPTDPLNPSPAPALDPALKGRSQPVQLAQAGGTLGTSPRANAGVQPTPGVASPIPESLPGQEDLRKALSNPNVTADERKHLLDMLEKRGAVKELKIPGIGTVQYDAHGRQSFFPEIQKGHIDLGDGIKIETQHKYNPETKQTDTQFLIPGGQGTTFSNINNVMKWAQEQHAKRQALAANATEDAKKFNTEYHAIQSHGVAANEAVQRFTLMRQLIRDPNFYSGIGANKVLDIAKLGSVISGNPKWSGSMEAFAKLVAGTNLAGLDQFRGLGQIRVAEIQLLQKAMGELNNTPGAINAIIEINDRLAKRNIKVAEMANEYASTHGDRLDKGWNVQLADWINKKENHLFTEDEEKNYKQFFDISDKSKLKNKPSDPNKPRIYIPGKGLQP